MGETSTAECQARFDLCLPFDISHITSLERNKSAGNDDLWSFSCVKTCLTDYRISLFLSESHTLVINTERLPPLSTCKSIRYPLYLFCALLSPAETNQTKSHTWLSIHLSGLVISYFWKYVCVYVWRGSGGVLLELKRFFVLHQWLIFKMLSAASFNPEAHGN